MQNEAIVSLAVLFLVVFGVGCSTEPANGLRLGATFGRSGLPAREDQISS